MKILFFIETLRSGGKERRLLELIKFLLHFPQYEILLVLTDNVIHYNYVYDFGIDLRIINRKRIKKDPLVFIKFYKLCTEFNPDIIHTWGSMLAFYSIPAIILKNIPHVNSHITNVPNDLRKFGFQNTITKLGFSFSRIILSNSNAGLVKYGVSGEKCKVIYNGVDLKRFTNFETKEITKARFDIRTPYTIIMAASYTPNKNYSKFIDLAEFFSNKRDDITFLGLGDKEINVAEFERIRERAIKLNNVRLYGKIIDVESVINACDIGVLFAFSEGLSNSIIEYMACGKPVIADDSGGTKEILVNKELGFLITNETTEEIACIINDLLDNEAKRDTIGENAKHHIEKYFSIERIGNAFRELYLDIIQ
ncbi:MAG: glycosyltransferase [Candidatus Thorarchaeota archaeon]